MGMKDRFNIHHISNEHFYHLVPLIIPHDHFRWVPMPNLFPPINNHYIHHLSLHLFHITHRPSPLRHQHRRPRQLLISFTSVQNSGLLISHIVVHKTGLMRRRLLPLTPYPKPASSLVLDLRLTTHLCSVRNLNLASLFYINLRSKLVACILSQTCGFYISHPRGITDVQNSGLMSSKNVT